MADEAIAQRVRDFRASYTGASEATLGGNSTPQDTEGWDSLANPDLLAAIEWEYG
jgi:acyl carrier protein